jgi:hypothetical protein
VGDTIPHVKWSLELKCPFRHGENWFLPTQSHQQLSDLLLVDYGERNERCVEGICVTTWRRGRNHAGRHYDSTGNRWDVPLTGFRIAERLGPERTWPVVLSTCGKCEANVQGSYTNGVAGCFGALICPDPQRLEHDLRSIIHARGWETRVSATFTRTLPLWYGFWTDSPLAPSQVLLLFKLLSALSASDHWKKVFKPLRNALSAALRYKLPIHVVHSPPGHVDFGWYTVFPHCPRCKAAAPFERWRERYPTTLYECAVCSHSYVPNDNHRSEDLDDLDDGDWDRVDLPSMLGADYLMFVKTFLLHRGFSADQADEVLDDVKSGRSTGVTFS